MSDMTNIVMFLNFIIFFCLQYIVLFFCSQYIAAKSEELARLETEYQNALAAVGLGSFTKPTSLYTALHFVKVVKTKSL